MLSRLSLPLPDIASRWSISPKRLSRSLSNACFRVSPEIRTAISGGKPVVALETTVYTHGFPYPQNLSLASRLESLVRTNGGIPATIGVLDGVATVGLSPEELIRLISTTGHGSTIKVSRRDLSHICGLVRFYKRSIEHNYADTQPCDDRDWLVSH